MNVRLVVCAVLASVSAVGFSSDKPKVEGEKKVGIKSIYSGMTPEQKAAAKADRNLKMLKRDGGIIEIPGSCKGFIAFVNTQKRVADFDGGKISRLFGRNFHYDIRFSNSDPVTPATAEAQRAKLKANIAVFVVDDPALGTMLTAPEERWAIVNVARLAIGEPSAATLTARVRKEVLRAIAYLTAGSSYETTLVNAISKPSDLDNIAHERYPVDVTMRMHSYLTSSGVTRRSYDTYRNAIASGYDVAPTNQYQKAIWEEVHKLPTDPLPLVKPKK